jgi:Glycosyltransferase family 87
MKSTTIRLVYTQVVLIAAAVVLGEALAIAGHGLAGRWMVGPDGRGHLYDFAAFWVAGHFALEGHATTAYDWQMVRNAEISLTGDDAQPPLPFLNAPHFLLALIPLATFPYHIAFLIFVVVSMGLYATAIATISGRWTAVIALASPPVLACAMVGQNGMLSAALIGFALLAIERRPVIGGLLLSLMTYKPQFGLLFPLALGSNRQWTTFTAATVGSLLLLILTGAVFGFEIFRVALQGVSTAWQEIIVNGSIGWRRLHSLYGLARTLGLGHLPALVAQIAFAVLTAGALIALWRRPVAYELKAAGLAAGCLLPPPYVFSYDFPILSVAVAFLWREREFDVFEWVVLGFCGLLLLLATHYGLPLAFLVCIAVLALVFRRASPRLAKANQATSADT